MAAAGSKWAIFVGNFGNLDRFAGRLRFPWRENWDFFVRKFGDLEKGGFCGPRPICLPLGWSERKKNMRKKKEHEREKNERKKEYEREKK